MPRLPAIVLRRFPLVETMDLSVARRATSRFWPSHRSRVVGPEAYAVTINRALLGDLADTFVDCTARLIVEPLEASGEGCLVVPLSGCVEIDTGDGPYRAVPGQPLFRAPAMIRRFEASPTRCLLVDLPMARLREACGERIGNAPLDHTVLRDDDAVAAIAHTVGITRIIDRSRNLVALQSRSPADRRRLLPRSVEQVEQRFIDVLAEAIGSARRPYPPAANAVTQSSIEATLRLFAFSGFPITDVARRAGLSARTLQRACERRGYSPLDFIRGIQPDRAHELLSRATERDTVAAIAIAVGMTHPGRFSRAYRQRFGELPSATLARATRAGEPGVSDGPKDRSSTNKT